MSYNNPTFVGDDASNDRVSTLELATETKVSNRTVNGIDKNQVSKRMLFNQIMK